MKYKKCTYKSWVNLNMVYSLLFNHQQITNLALFVIFKSVVCIMPCILLTNLPTSITALIINVMGSILSYFSYNIECIKMSGISVEKACASPPVTGSEKNKFWNGCNYPKWQKEKGREGYQVWWQVSGLTRRVTCLMGHIRYNVEGIVKVQTGYWGYRMVVLSQCKVQAAVLPLLGYNSGCPSVV